MAGLIAGILLLCFVYRPMGIIALFIFLTWQLGWQIVFGILVFGLMIGAVGNENTKYTPVSTPIKKARRSYGRNQYKSAFKKALGRNLR